MSAMPHNPAFLPSVLSAVLFLSAGAGLFLMLVNRVLIGLDLRGGKNLLIVTVGLVMMGLPAFHGYRNGWSNWTPAPIAVLALVAGGEVRRFAIRRRYRGSPPLSDRKVGRSRLMTTTNLRLTRYEVRHSGWRGPTLRVAHISDIHMHDAYPRAYLAEIVRSIKDVAPDLVFITGDFISRLRHLSRLPELLRPIADSCATYAVLGNHDYWLDAEAVSRAVQSSGVVVLRDDTRALDHAGGMMKILLRGYEHPWGCDGLTRILGSSDSFAIVLTHTPDNIHRLSAAGAHSVFAGHFHAGQIRIPRIGPIVIPSRYGRLFDHGHFVVNGTHLFATAGVGASGPPIRICCPPEIQVVDFTEYGPDERRHHPAPTVQP
ncbi:MAG: metallophosphoesterase family protein [Vicinamibacteria bacterium]|nr:metallophosphoesterase family protein [Vicinamibacteria bacterium]